MEEDVACLMKSFLANNTGLPTAVFKENPHAPGTITHDRSNARRPGAQMVGC
jgi:hypothetical protein